MKTNKNPIIALLVMIGMAACQHPSVSPDNVQVSPNCSPDSVYFVKDVLPVILSNCAMSGCHNSVDKADGIVLVDYASIMKDGEVEPYKASSSDLYKSLIKSGDERMPLGMPPLNSSLIAMIKKWIDQGAKNNDCLSCDSTNTVSYAQHIVPILQTNCYGCHNATNAQGGIDISTYDKLLVKVNDSTLYGSVNYLYGYSAMPQGAAKLNNCNLSLINKWIANGAPNN